VPSTIRSYFSQEDGLATFSEKELLVLFWGQPLLASKVWELAKDELEIQFIAYKLKELQSAGFKRVPDDWLPQNRLISTVAGVNYFLTEIRKVVRTKVDVMRLWPQDDCGPDKLKTQKDIERLWSEGTYDPEKIKVECIDLGQAFVMGSPALLSDALGFDKKGKMMFSDQRKKGKPSATSSLPRHSLPHQPSMRHPLPRQPPLRHPLLSHRLPRHPLPRHHPPKRPPLHPGLYSTIWL
jgi:hypothetical protein